MVNSNKRIQISCISEARGLLLGIATILVVLFHSPLLDFTTIINIKFISEILNFIKILGNSGVDIFLFISGIGLYFSMTKNNVKDFYKNRFLRVIPSLIFVNYIYFSIIKDLNLKEFWLHFFLLDLLFTGDRVSWYFCLIIFLYLFYPILHKIVEKFELMGVILLIDLIFLCNFGINICFPHLYSNIEIALTRIPVFIMGIYFGNLSFKKREISLKNIVLSFLIEFFVLIVLYFLYTKKNPLDILMLIRYLYCPLAVTASINISVIYNFLKDKIRILFLPIIFVGKYSMEIYLLYEKILIEFSFVTKMNSYFIYYFMNFVITLLLSIILQRFIKKLVNIIGYIFLKLSSKIRCIKRV